VAGGDSGRLDRVAPSGDRAAGAAAAGGGRLAGEPSDRAGAVARDSRRGSEADTGVAPRRVGGLAPWRGPHTQHTARWERS
jgi:hypothetical protein